MSLYNSPPVFATTASTGKYEPIAVRRNASCAICNSTVHPRQCGRCHSIEYCSNECQKLDWRTHKLVCRLFEKQERFSHNERLAFYFHPDQKSVQLKIVRAQLVGKTQEYIPSSQRAILLSNKAGSNDGGSPMYRWIDENVVRERILPDSLLVWERDGFLLPSDGSKLNQALLTAVGRPMSLAWSGPIIVVKGTRLMSKTKAYTVSEPRLMQSVTASDFRDVVDYYASYYHDIGFFGSRTFPTILQTAGRLRKGARLACHGDTSLLKMPKRSAATITEFQAEYENRTSPVAALLGLPVHVNRCIPHPSWSHGEPIVGRSPFDNSVAHALFQNLSSEEGELGMQAVEWRSCIGSVIVTRAHAEDAPESQRVRELAPLTMKEVRTLCNLSATIRQLLRDAPATINDTLESRQAFASASIYPLIRIAAKELGVKSVV